MPLRRYPFLLLLAVAVLLLSTLLWRTLGHDDKLTIAAASDLKFALDEVVAQFRAAHPAHEVEVIYGSSGRFHAQIQRGAPYDLYFSADIDYAQSLHDSGHAASEVRPYALGRLVLWSAQRDASAMTLDSLREADIRRIAIANPRHAPYGQRAEEALRAAGLWQEIESRLVLGESISHAAQYVQSGNAQVGLIALALALSPELSGLGGYWLIPDTLHSPLEQGFIVTRRARDKPLAWAFADYIQTAEARAIMASYGFELPASTGL